MASGWALDGTVQDQIDDTDIGGVMRARMPTVKGEPNCLERGEESRNLVSMHCSVPDLATGVGVH